MRKAWLLLIPIAVQAQSIPPSHDVTMGRYISAGMTMVYITQDSLAKILPPVFGITKTARSVRLSAMRAGRWHETDSIFGIITRVLDSLAYHASMDTSAIPRAMHIYQTVHAKIHPPVTPPAPAPPPPTPPPTPPPPVVVATLPITSGSLADDSSTYRLIVHAHGLTTGRRVVVRNHGIPSIEGRMFYVQVTGPDIFRLWWNVQLNVPVKPGVNGTGGMVEVLQ